MAVINTLVNEPDIEGKLRQAADVISQAFKTENITTTMYDFSVPEKFKTWEEINYFSAIKLYETGEKVILAEVDDKVIGAAYLRDSNQGSILDIIRAYFPDILKFIIPAIKALNIRKILRSAKLFKTKKIPAENYYNLEVIGINSEYQGRGIARILLEEAEKFIRELEDYDGIYLYTGNEDTKNLYQHLGYQLIEQKENKYLTIYHMYKPVRREQIA